MNGIYRCVAVDSSRHSDSIVVDPILKEEAVCAGRVCIAMNTHSEVCLVRKMGAVALSAGQVGVA
jgi:exosome complex RNA-binding protein Rrp42 (RNase PH superfamily)